MVIDQSNKKISGTLHYVNYTYSGHYLILYFDPNWIRGINWTSNGDPWYNIKRPIYTKFDVELVGGTKPIVQTIAESYSAAILRITDQKTQKIKVTCFKESSAVYTEIFSLTDLVLEPKA